MKRIAVVLGAGLAMIGMSLAMQVAAWGVGSPSSAVITFDDVAQSVTLTIPTPACPATQPGCRWKFFLNEPKLHVDVAILYGTSGTLTIPYPPNFCGVIQADAYIGGPPWVPKRGWQHTISDCAVPNTPVSTTSSTMAPDAPIVAPTSTSAPTTTMPATSEESPVNTQAPVVAGVVAGASDAPQTAPSVAQPKTAAVVSPTQLPFTGIDIKPLFFLGLTMVGLGLSLMFRVRRGAHSRR
jgi:hypothetical protein